MCEFCENIKRISYEDKIETENKEFSREKLILCYIDNKLCFYGFNKYSYEDDAHYMNMNINYCLICGRKLCDETEAPIEHFLKSEIERSELRMNAYAECFDGIHIDNDTRKKLLQSHIRFCKNALKQCMDV